MQYKTLTISREYGSGGGEVAAIIAEKLGWQLVDKNLISAISRKSGAPEEKVADFDEKTDSWLHRISRTLWGKDPSKEAISAPALMFDATAAAALSKKVIEEAHIMGNCVIVGRGAQCVLKDKSDAFHAFIYASLADRVQRIRKRQPEVADISKLIHAVEGERRGYISMNYGVDKYTPQLYNLMVDSRNQMEKTAQLIITAMELGF